MTTSNQSLYLRIKAVPGVSRDVIAGLLGDRLKVRTNAPPENGKANKAVCKLIAKAIGIKAGQVHVHRGHTNPEKTICIEGASTEAIVSGLGLDAGELMKITLHKD